MAEMREVLLLGSVALDSAEAVFRAAGAAVGDKVRRLPDGETGYARSLWIQCQTPFFLGHPQLEMVEPDPEKPGEYRPAHVPSIGLYSPTMVGGYRGQARLREGVAPEDLSFDNLGYADWAEESYLKFSRLREEGVLNSRTRFQVSIPSPYVTARLRSLPQQLSIIAPAYEAAVFREIERLTHKLPPQDLAIQWDCTEPVGYKAMPPEVRHELVGRLGRLATAVPEGVELGYHLCYGDYEHKHFEEPDDSQILVEMANAIAAVAQRPIDWLHLPVPRERDDEAYFAPMQGLKLLPETRLFLGLVHHTDGVEGAIRRMRAASKYVADFGIGTECGMGRRPPGTIEELLHIHSQASEAEL